MFDIPTEVGKLIEARKAYGSEHPCFHIYNNLVSLLREWPKADNERKVMIAKGIKYQRSIAEKHGAKFH